MTFKLTESENNIEAKWKWKWNSSRLKVKHEKTESENEIQHIEAKTKQSPLYRWHFQMNFLEWKIFDFD